MPRTGRPELEDDATLLAMAEVVLGNPQIAIADAVRIVIADFSNEQSEEAAIRRLRDKFNSKRPFLLETVQRDTPKRRVYLMSPNRVSFHPAAFFKVSEALQLSINLPKMQRMNERMAQIQKLFVSPEMQRIRQTLEAASRSLNTPEMRHMIQQTREASNVISRRLNMQRFA